MMAIVEINLNNPQAANLLQYIRNLPFTTVIEEERADRRFEQAVAECDGRPASEFFDELRKQVKDHFRSA